MFSGHPCSTDGSDDFHCLTYINDHYAFHCVAEGKIRNKEVICLNEEERKSNGGNVTCSHRTGGEGSICFQIDVHPPTFDVRTADASQTGR